MEQNSYYSIIPTEILLNKNLSSTAKLVYALITSLTKKEGYCWCSNEYLSQAFDVSLGTIKRTLKELREAEYIQCEYNDNNNERKIYLNTSFKGVQKCDGGGQKTSRGGAKNEPRGRSKNEPHNNINNNNKLNNKNNKDIYSEFVKFYNENIKSLKPISSFMQYRKKALDKILKDYDFDTVKSIILKVEQSDFLTGRNGVWGNCGIDWILNYKNFVKIYEGNYDNKGIVKKGLGSLVALTERFLNETQGGNDDNRIRDV